MKAYLASGFGFSESTRDFMYRIVLPKLRSIGLEVINPWDLTTDAEIEAARGSHKEADLRSEIGRRNVAAIDQADFIVANLDGQEVDSGVAWEIGYAFGRGKRCYAWRSDFRVSGEPGGRVNLQVAYGVYGEIEPNLDKLVARIAVEERAHCST